MTEDELAKKAREEARLRFSRWHEGERFLFRRKRYRAGLSSRHRVEVAEVVLGVYWRPRPYVCLRDQRTRAILALEETTADTGEALTPFLPESEIEPEFAGALADRIAAQVGHCVAIAAGPLRLPSWPEDWSEPPFVLCLEAFVHLTDFEVDLEVASGNLLRWLHRRRFQERDLDEIPPAEEMIAIAEREEPPPEGAKVDFVEPMRDGKLVFVSWKHLHEGILVEPDFCMSSVDAKNRVVVAHSRRWTVL